MSYIPSGASGSEATQNARACSPRLQRFCYSRKNIRKRIYVYSDPATQIFVVDDEPVIASTLAAILQMNGFSAKFFTSPLEALAAARSKAPDLLISDVTMPGFSGIDLAMTMRAQYPQCKILLFSGHPATFRLIEEARVGGHEFHLLLKPLPPAELLLEIGKIVDANTPIPVHTTATGS
jgi:DNA-binding NtrC family response regulator